VKIGALGVFCMALPDRGLGLAVKVHSGSTEALAAAVETTLQIFAPGAFAAPEGWGLLQVRNVVGDVVGGWRVRQG
jgi:L-asparaginase II